MYDAVIIGGGASGLAAAITAAKCGRSVLVLECGARVGKKVAAAGNGKCNLGNTAISAEMYNNRFVEGFLPQSSKVKEFFDELGLRTRVIDGRVYPYSESGNSVLNILRAAVGEERIRTDYCVTDVSKRGDGYVINGEIATKKVILATGSEATYGRASYELYKKFGHTVTALTPVLTPLRTDVTEIKGLAGVRAKVGLSLFADGDRVFYEEGELLFKDNGVSGIVAMSASRFLTGKDELAIDFVPDMSEEETEKFLRVHSAEGLMQRVIAEAVYKQAARLKNSVGSVLKNFRIGDVRGGGIKQAQVMRGGLETAQFDGELQSVLEKGLYACGEVLDVDGACGGYNLHWAFLSGITVGEAI